MSIFLEKKGYHLYSIYPHGSTDKLPYTTMGSGSLAAMAVFESRWKPDLEEAEGIQLVCTLDYGIYIMVSNVTI